MSALQPDTAASAADDVRVIHRTDDYRDAERIIDRLSDQGFDVEQARIVGRGLHSVEQITGRMTKGRAALAGAGSGAWFGLFVGLLFALFVVGPAWFSMIVSAVVIGALFGAVLGFAGHWATRGRRDFSSVKGLRADTYEIQVEPSHADEARRMAGLA